MNKKLIKFLSVLVIMIMALTALTACGGSDEPAATDGEAASAGATIILVDQDWAEYTYEVESGKNVKDALHDAGLIDDDNYTKFMAETIDGHTALMEDGVLWLMCDENRNQIQGLFEEHVIAEGETLYLIYTVAPNFDDW